jgi:hypothetical protein
MKKKNLVLFIGIGFLAILPFIRVSVAAPPSWVGIAVGDTYSWTYDTDTTARDGAWTTDGVALLIFTNFGEWVGWVDDGEMGALGAGGLSHEITAVEDLAADIEYLTGYSSVAYTGAVTADFEWWTGDWADKDTGLNVWNGFIIENEDDFVEYHSGLAGFFNIYGFTYHTIGLFVPSGDFFDWGEIVTLANANITDATVTVLTNSTTSEEIGFKITVAATAWTTNTLALTLEVTYDSCGLLDVWDMKYGSDSILTITQTAGSTCTPYVTPAPAIPGYELPIVIGITAVSIISLILIKKIKNK